VIIEQAWQDRRIRKIVDGLIERSMSGEAEWQIFSGQTSARRIASPGKPDGFSYSTDSATVVVGSSDGDGASPYYLNIIDSAGILVESVSAPSTPRTRRMPDGSLQRQERSPEETEFGQLLRELYERARRNALKTDDVLDALVDELSS
jgi:hypothetical protein